MFIENTKTRALLFLRVSTAKQLSGDEASQFPAQQARCEEFCIRNGWEIVDTITESKSGHKNEMYGREAVVEIKNRAKNGEFDILVVFKLDRLGRRGVETANFIMNLLDAGIRIYSATEGEISNDTFEGKLMLVMKGLLAKQESRNTSVRVKASLDIVVANGGYRGGPPMFGYKLVPTGKTNRKGRMINNLCIEEREAELVRQLFRMTAEEGKGTHQLAEYLNNKGIKTHNGAKFQPTKIMRILKNRICIGHLDTKDIKRPYQEYQLCEKEKKLILEIGNALIGESRFTPDQLNDSLEAVKAERINTEEAFKNCTKRLENLSAEKEYAKNGYSKLTTWAEEYSLAGTERKKMIIAEIFDRVEIKKGYEIEITMNEIYRPFMTVQMTKED